MSKVAVFLADGFEEIEALTPVDYLRRAGAEVVTVGVKGTINGNKMVVTGSHKIPVIADLTFDEYLENCKKELPDCVFCPGGLKGSQNLADCDDLLKNLEKCFDNKKLVCAICAAPSLVLGKTKIMKGKKWTCYPGMAENSAPEYFDGYCDKVFVTDENVVTARGAGAAEQFAMELVRILEGEQKAKQVHDGTVQR